MEDNRDVFWKESLIGCFSYVLGIVIGILMAFLLAGCTTTKYVPVVQTNTEHHWHTDTVREKDSTYHEKTTTIMQLDSSEMAKYGIHLQNAERAWLVKTDELQRQIERLEAMSQTRDSIHDSIPAPYPVEVKVPAELTWWQRLRIDIADILMGLLAIASVVWGVRLAIKHYV